MARKLRSILFTPVVKLDLDRPGDWYIRSPFIWMPGLAAQEQLKKDYEAIRDVVVRGKLDELSSSRPPRGQGVHMMANTAGKDSRDITSFEVGGMQVTTKRRAWMLRGSFTTLMVRENLAYRSPVRQHRTGADP